MKVKGRRRLMGLPGGWGEAGRWMRMKVWEARKTMEGQRGMSGAGRKTEIAGGSWQQWKGGLRTSLEVAGGGP